MRWLVLLGLICALPAQAETVRLPGPDGTTLTAELLLPAGPPVAPAIVALHGCAGPYPARDMGWARALAAAGHIVLLPNSFGSRGLGSQCRERHRIATSGGLRRLDAIAAARWLEAQPGTPPGGVALLGWSDGGSTVLAAIRQAPDLPPGLLRAAVAFYPGCRGASVSTTWQPAVPLLILHGAADDWTPVAPCEVLAARHPAEVELHAYPGAYHDFDAPGPVHVLHNIPTSQNADHSVHLGNNAAARADAITRVPAFLESAGP
jgi:dienelactone hydrolase